MGIKGLYRELGAGERVSLCKLAVQSLEERGRPLRLAIDFSIWEFQTQAARGGSNPALRTLFYRLVRLLGLSIQPIFVFDGPYKPRFKRNKRSGRSDGSAAATAKQLIKLFGFPVHQAPGEAEAECALLQQMGIADAVLSEDVDTIMFGSTKTLRNWSSEGTKGTNAPTHVSVYATQTIFGPDTGLDKDGLVLVALMSGGDYLPDGVPGCGPKVALEAAKGGFGQSLCALTKSDAIAVADWRDSLRHELQTNEKGIFRSKHKALTIPDTFPDIEALRHYTQPVVSPRNILDALKEEGTWSRLPDIQGLREFSIDKFDWTYRIGAIKLIRVLAPSLLVKKLYNARYRVTEGEYSSQDTIIQGITTRRTHLSTGGIPELRVSYIPNDIVGYNFEKEPGLDDAGEDMDLEDEFDEHGGADGQGGRALTSKKGFDPRSADLAWVPETIVKWGAQKALDDFEEAVKAKEAAKRKPKSTGPLSKRVTATREVAGPGPLDIWASVAKTIPHQISKVPADGTQSTSRPPTRSSIRPPSLALPTQAAARLTIAHERAASSLPKLPPSKPSRSKQSMPSPSRVGTATSTPAAGTANPWVISGSQIMPRVTKPSTSRTAAVPQTPTKSPRRRGQSDLILISSSPPRGDGKGIPSPLDSATSSVTRSLAGVGNQRSVWDVEAQSPKTLVDPLAAITLGSSSSLTEEPRKPRQSALGSPTKGPRPSRSKMTDSLVGQTRNHAAGAQLGVSPRTNVAANAGIGHRGGETGTESKAPRLDSYDDEAIFGDSEGKGKAKTFVVPRDSAVGYFRTVELGSACTTAAPPNSINVDEISIVDLTGDD